jgi:hypothetical protein
MFPPYMQPRSIKQHCNLPRFTSPRATDRPIGWKWTNLQKEMVVEASAQEKSGGAIVGAQGRGCQRVGLKLPMQSSFPPRLRSCAPSIGSWDEGSLWIELRQKLKEEDFRLISLAAITPNSNSNLCGKSCVASGLPLFDCD